MNRVSEMMRWWRIDALGLLAVTLVSAACYYGLIQPVIRSRLSCDALKPQIAQRSLDVQAARTQLAALEDDLDTVTAELAERPLKLQPSTRVNTRLAGLTDTAADLGLKLHQVLPRAFTPGDRYGLVPIQLSGQGDYRQIVGFMRSVNEQFADVAVIGFDLQSAGQPGEPAKFNIDLAWYTLPAMGLAEK